MLFARAAMAASPELHPYVSAFETAYVMIYGDKRCSSTSLSFLFTLTNSMAAHGQSPPSLAPTERPPAKQSQKRVSDELPDPSEHQGSPAHYAE